MMTILTSAQVNVCRMSCAGADTTNSNKQAGSFQLTQGGPKLVGLVAAISDIHALGQQFAEGVTLTTAYCWDRDDKSRAFARKFERLVRRAMVEWLERRVRLSRGSRRSGRNPDFPRASSAPHWRGTPRRDSPWRCRS